MLGTFTLSLTGYVMPIGNGAVGKSCTARVLDRLDPNQHNYASIINSITKTKNLEFEFIPLRQSAKGTDYNILAQILVPPGQKYSEGDRTSRSFEAVMDIYRFHLRRLDVVLFTYNLIQRETFYDLNFWVTAVSDFLDDATHFILLGTHLDLPEKREISQEDIYAGLKYIEKQIEGSRPAWKGKCTSLEISNLTGKNMHVLKKYLAFSIIRSRQLIP